MDNITVDLGPETAVAGRRARRRSSAPTETSARRPRSSRTALGTINYEIAVRRSRARVPRAYHRDGAPGVTRPAGRAGASSIAPVRGWSAARCATGCSGAPTADFDVAIDGDPRPGGASAGARAPAATRSSSRRGSACGGSSPATTRWQVDLLPLAGRLDRGRPRASATSRSTRSPSRSAAASSSIRSAGSRDLRERRLRMVVAGRVRATIRCARCGSRGSPASSTSRSSRGPPRPRSRAAPALARVAPERVFAELKRIIARRQRAATASS